MPRKLEKYFEVLFSNVYFKLAKGKVIFLFICQKKSDQKGHLQLIFLLERSKEGELVFALVHQVLRLSDCVQMIYFEKPTLHSEKSGDGAPVPRRVSAKRIISGNQHPALGRPVHTQANVLI